MGRFYVEYDMARFHRKDITLVDMELIDGRKLENLEPRRLFPLSGLEKYITLLDQEGVEQGIIRDLRTLPKQDREIIEGCLREYYLIPKVTAIDNIVEKFGLLTIYVQTDRGDAKIAIRNQLHGIKLLHGSRVLFRDNNDNRYEIPDINQLDKHSRQLMDQYL